MLHQFDHQFTPSDTAHTHHIIRISTMLSEKPIIVTSDFQIYWHHIKHIATKSSTIFCNHFWFLYRWHHDNILQWYCIS